MWTYLFGPRVNYRHLGRITPFGQTLFGIAHTTSDVYLLGHNQTDFAMTVGVGFDYRLSHRLSLRPIQVDYLLTRFNLPGRATGPRKAIAGYPQVSSSTSSCEHGVLRLAGVVRENGEVGCPGAGKGRVFQAEYAALRIIAVRLFQRVNKRGYREVELAQN